MRAHRRGLVALATASLSLLTSRHLHADNYYWNDANGGNFGDTANWDPNGVPGVADSARFEIGGIYTVNIGDATTDSFLLLGGEVTLNTGFFGTSIFQADSVATLNSGSISTGHGFIGYNAFTNAEFSVNNSYFNAVQYISVGREGNGTLSVTNASQFAAGYVDVGIAAGTTGKVVIDHSLAFLSNSLYLADQGVAEMYVQNGANVSTKHIIITRGTGGNGKLVVDGAGTKMTVEAGNVVNVGEVSGAANLTISNGALLDSAGVVQMGVGDLGSGFLFVKGTDSKLLALTTTVNVGKGGYGEAEISDHGFLETEFLNIGEQSAGEGEMNVDNGSVKVNDAFNVGKAGVGTLNIKNGGTVIAANGVILAASANGAGTVVIDGAGSTFELNQGTLSAGTVHTADITVQNGGKFETGATGSTFLRIAAGAASTSYFKVMGTGSSLAPAPLQPMGATVDVGYAGIGNLHLTSQATGEVGAVKIGTLANSTGELRVNNATLTITGLAPTGGSTPLIIGDAGTGTLTILDGGVVTAPSMIMARSGTSNDPSVTDATLTISGTGSKLHLDGWADGGNARRSYIEISDGGLLEIASGMGFKLSNGANATGTLLLDGATSKLNAVGSVTAIGSNGHGIATVRNGALLDTTHMHLAWSVGSDGDLLVETGGKVKVGNFFGLGSLGNGLLEIKSGGVVEAKYTTLGNERAAAIGTLTVEGTGSEFKVTGWMWAGNNGAAVISVKDQGLFTLDPNTGLELAIKSTGGAAAMTVEGVSSKVLGSSADVYIGAAGNGTLEVKNAAHVETKGLIIGKDSTSNGTATLDGFGSLIDVTNLTISRSGPGKLTVTDRALLEIDEGTIGENSGVEGELIVKDATTGFLVKHNGSLTIGKSGKGKMTVSYDADVSSESGAKITIGKSANSEGTLTLTGSGTHWVTASNSWIVGESGNGVLNVFDRAQIDFVGSLTIGVNAGSTGKLIVTGDDSKYTGHSTFAGRGGQATIRIGENGKVDVKHFRGATTADGDVTININGEHSILDVHGAGTLPTFLNDPHNRRRGEFEENDGNDGLMALGMYGSGAATVENKGTLHTSGLVVGWQAGSTGTLVIKDAGSNAYGGILWVGDSGAALVQVQNQGKLDYDDIYIGGHQYSGGSYSRVEVDGVGSLLKATGVLRVADVSSGALYATGGAQVQIQDFEIGNDGHGEVLVTGVGTGLVAQDVIMQEGQLQVLDQAVVQSGGVKIKPLNGQQAIVTLSTGATWDMSNNLFELGVVRFDPFGQPLTDGYSYLNIENGAQLICAEIDVRPRSRIEGSGGTIVGNVRNQGGYIAPGFSPGTLTIVGDYIQEAGGVLELEASGTGAGEYDILNVTGTITLGGDVVLSFLNGFAPKAGDVFDFFAGTEPAVGNFSSISVAGLLDGWEYNLDSSTGTLTSLNDAVAVPEPSVGFASVLLGGLGLLRRRRRLA